MIISQDQHDRTAYFNILPYRRLCIIYEKKLKFKQIGMDRNRKYGRVQQLAVSKVMTILIMFQITQYRNFRAYYNEFIKIYWSEYFPQAPSYNRFVELMQQAILPLSYF